MSLPWIRVLAVESDDELIDDGVYDVGWEKGESDLSRHCE